MTRQRRTMPSHLIDRWEREGFAALTRSAHAGGRKAAALRRRQREPHGVAEQAKPVDNPYARAKGISVEPVAYPALLLEVQLVLDLRPPSEPTLPPESWWKKL